jgi:hypothetical protein
MTSITLFFACHHALCNAHHLRELTYVFEQMGQSWANRLIEMLLAPCQEVERIGGPLPPDRIAYFRSLYLEILATGEAANPRAPPSGKRGRTRQSKAVNLLHRLRTYTDDVLRFMSPRRVEGRFDAHLATLLLRSLPASDRRPATRSASVMARAPMRRWHD